jgi:hypothetical protein
VANCTRSVRFIQTGREPSLFHRCKLSALQRKSFGSIQLRFLPDPYRETSHGTRYATRKITMPSRMMIVLTCVILAAACRQSGQSLQRQQQQYDVVQEGASGTVTSSLGEGTATTAPAVSASTGTGVDTTTSFTLGNLAPMGSTPPGPIAGTLPVTASFTGAPLAQDRIRITRTTPGEAAASSTVTTSEPATAPPGETARPAISSDTATASSTGDAGAAAFPASPTTNDRKRDRSSDAPAPEPPPPPPPTDTTGTQASGLRPDRVC